MSYFPVRPIAVGSAVFALAFVIRESADSFDHPAELAVQPQVVAEPEHQVKEDQPALTLQEVPLYEVQKTECSSPIKGEGMSQLLARLMKEVQPDLSAHEVAWRTESPHDSLYTDAITLNPQGTGSVLNVVDTICVVRHINDDRSVVWSVYYLGYLTALH